MQGLTAVHAAAPERIIGIGDVSNPLAVPCEVQLPSRDTGEKRHELMRLNVVADKFTPALPAGDK